MLKTKKSHYNWYKKGGISINNGNYLRTGTTTGVRSVPCGRYGNVFRFMPPLTVPRDMEHKDTDILIDILKHFR